jgi:hypothetical protein
VLSLARSSSPFYQVWRSNAASISNSVLPRAVECLYEVEQLLEAKKLSDANNFDSVLQKTLLVFSQLRLPYLDSAFVSSIQNYAATLQLQGRSPLQHTTSDLHCFDDRVVEYLSKSVRLASYQVQLKRQPPKRFIRMGDSPYLSFAWDISPRI